MAGTPPCGVATLLDEEGVVIGLRVNLWFDGCAEEAARFYCSVFEDSAVLSVNRLDAPTPGTEPGDVLLVEFQMGGVPFIALNGGPMFSFSEATSLEVRCEDQQEVDYYWDALLADGGEASQCGWLKDRFGMSWQVVPQALGSYIGGPDPQGAARAMECMLRMSKLDIDAIREAYEHA